MIKKRNFYKILFLTSIFVSIITWHLNNYIIYRTNDGLTHKFRSVAGVIQKYAIDNPGSENLQIASISGMINSTDNKENLYLTSSMVKEYNLKPHKESFSIGIKTSKVIDYFMINFVEENSYAYNIGIRNGDLIQSVNKKKCKDYYSLGELLHNKKNVLINIKRNNENLSFLIEDNIVKNHDLLQIYNAPNNINNKIINLQDFDSNNINEMIYKNIENLNNNENCSKIIIDLRNNNSFSFKDAQKIVNKITSNNNKTTPYMYMQNKKQYEEYEKDKTQNKSNKSLYMDPYYSEQNTKFIKKPLVVLLNKNSYSAAEIIASSLKNIESATIIGEKSHGRGYIDEIVPVFTDDTALKISTHNWYTHNLENLNNTKGIIPDINIEDSLPFKIKFISAIKSYIKGDKDETLEINTIKNTKRFLKYLGYSINNEDGYFDEELYKEILNFQLKNNIEQTGNIDTETIIKINNYLLDYTTNKQHDLVLNKVGDINN